MRKKSYALLLLSVILLFFCLTGCERKEGEKTEITFIHGWGSTEVDHVAMRQIYRDFEKENPDIGLNMISMPSSTDVIHKVGDLLAVGEIPDIIFTAGDGKESIYEFMVKKGYALNLMPWIQEDEKLKGSISPVALKYWVTQENELYTVSDVLLLSGGYWYNKDIFEQVGIKEPPLERTKWLEVCQKINEYKEKKQVGIEPVILDMDHVVYLTDALLFDENPELLTKIEDKKINLNSLGFRRTVMELEKIGHQSNIVNSFNFRDALASFNAKETAMYINGVWASSMISDELNISYAPLPTEDGKGVVAISSGVGYILGNTKDEKKIEAGIRFLKYMLSEEVAKRILEETGQIPANPNVEITKEIAGERLYQAVTCVNGNENVIEVPANIWGTTKKERYGNSMILYLDGVLSFKDLQRVLVE